jgi:hypothetical protein
MVTIVQQNKTRGVKFEPNLSLNLSPVPWLLLALLSPLQSADLKTQRFRIES